MKLVLRVDDVGWVPEDKSNDVNLQYFLKWRDAFGIAGFPVVYGVIPSTVTEKEIDIFRNTLTGGEELAVHGWDHARGARVDALQMQAGLDLFVGLKCQSYIPPFNEYSDTTICNWGKVCPKGVFFGGFEGEHHNLGDVPTEYFGTIHLNAHRGGYDRARQVLEWFDRVKSEWPYDFPVVLTLHATWDVNCLGDLKPLCEAISPYLIGTDEFKNWIGGVENCE